MTRGSERSTAASRRKFLLSSGIVAATALAGCSSNSGDGNGNGGSNSANSNSGSNDGNDGGNGNNNEEENSGSEGDDGFGEFDPNNPIESLPQTALTLFENDFDVGTAETLQNMESREEPVHGNPPLSVEETGEDYIDPDTISYAYGQGGDAANIYQDAMQPLMDNIEEETGKPVEFVTLNNPTAVVEAMRAERLHVSSVGAGTTPYLVNIGGGVPFSMLVNEGTFGYRMWTIAHVDNDDITGLSDLEGLKVAHSSETSNSGNLAPRALLPEEGLTPGEDYEVTYSGGHDNSIRGVISEDFEAANAASSIFGDMYSADEVDPSNVRVIYASQPFPSLPVQYRYNLEPEIVEGIRRAHFEYDYSGTSVEDAGGTEYVEFDYATHHHPVLLIQQSLDVEYEIGNLGE